MSYKKTEQTRQLILDYLNANPCRGETEILAAVGATRNEVHGSIKYMVLRRELAKIGQKRDVVYRARVTTTVSAEQVIADMKEGKRAGIREKPVVMGKQSSPGYYAQRGGNWQSKSSGGQGAVRVPVGVASSFGMV